MRIPLRAMLVALVAALLALTATTITPSVCAQAAPKPRPGDVQPLERAHAHNDYEHDRPLLDALDHGFTSVEADVWLVDGDRAVSRTSTSVPSCAASSTTPTRSTAATTAGSGSTST